jgi:hypothetical protein
MEQRQWAGMEVLERRHLLPGLVLLMQEAAAVVFMSEVLVVDLAAVEGVEREPFLVLLETKARQIQEAVLAAQEEVLIQAQMEALEL